MILLARSGLPSAAAEPVRDGIRGAYVRLRTGALSWRLSPGEAVKLARELLAAVEDLAAVEELAVDGA